MIEATNDDIFDVESDEDYLYSLSNTSDLSVINALVVNENI